MNRNRGHHSLRKLLPLLLCLVFPVAVRAQYNTTTNLDGTLTITGYTGPGGLVTIPTNINGLTVTSLANYAFNECTSLTSVTIPDSITNMGAGAFQFCSSLTNAAIGNGVASIGNYSFNGCTGLTSFTIGNSVTNIGNFAFAECTNLSDVTIGNSVSSISEDAFYVCTGLIAIAVDLQNAFYSSTNGVLFDKNQTTLLLYPAGVSGSYTIPGSVTSIGSGAFSYCTGLTLVTIPNSVTSIGSGAFAYSTSLTAITVDPQNAFYSSTNGVLFDKNQTVLLQFPSGLAGSYTIPGSVTVVGGGAFLGCTSLTSVTIGNGVTSIGASAFNGCTSLTIAGIGNGLTLVGNSAFSGCISLISVTIGSSVTNIQSSAFYYCTRLTNVAIPDSTTSIGDQAFYNCTSLTSVTIGNGLVSMGQSAFRQCTGLKSVTIHGNAASIGAFAFMLCTSLTNAIIANGVANIQAGAFSDCTQLPTILIPDSVTGVGNAPFLGCASLTAIMVSTNNVFYSSVDGVLFEKSQTTLVEFPAGVHGNYTIPSTVNSIGDYAFDGCTGLTGVATDDGITNIGTAAFTGCTSLTNITIPSSVTTIGQNAFAGCTSLTGVYFKGNAPHFVPPTSQPFILDNLVTVYYLPGAAGWGLSYTGPSLGVPAVTWNPRIATWTNSNFGVQANQFGFYVVYYPPVYAKIITLVVIEASTNAASPSWSRISTNAIMILASGLGGSGGTYFSDAQWTNFPTRFYRLTML